MTDSMREKAQTALRLYRESAPHIKARLQTHLLGELAKEWLREHREDSIAGLPASQIQSIPWQRRVHNWAESQGLGRGSDPCLMLHEMTDQVGELYEAIAADDRERVALRLGTVATLAAIMGQQMSLDLDCCQEIAWVEMTDRAVARVPGQGVFLREPEERGDW